MVCGTRMGRYGALAQSRRRHRRSLWEATYPILWLWAVAYLSRCLWEAAVKAVPHLSCSEKVDIERNRQETLEEMNGRHKRRRGFRKEMMRSWRRKHPRIDLR